MIWFINSGPKPGITDCMITWQNSMCTQCKAHPLSGKILAKARNHMSSVNQADCKSTNYLCLFSLMWLLGVFAGSAQLLLHQYRPVPPHYSSPAGMRYSTTATSDHSAVSVFTVIKPTSYRLHQQSSLCMSNTHFPFFLKLYLKCHPLRSEPSLGGGIFDSVFLLNISFLICSEFINEFCVSLGLG